jgi:hypothetical protein
MKQYRKDNPEYVETEKKRERAKSRALIRLKNLHESEYHYLLKQELERENARSRSR